MRIEDYVYDNYPELHGKVTREQVKTLFTQYPDHAVIVKNNGALEVVAFYYKLTDRTLKLIKTNKLDTSRPKNALRCLKEHGRNIHVILVVAESMKAILKGMRITIKKENAKTISGYTFDRSRIRQWRA